MDALIVFDGECNFCNYYINKLIDLDKKRVFLFTPFGSRPAIEKMNLAELNLDFRESFILFFAGKTYLKSSAAIKIMKQMGPFWRLSGWAAQVLVPRFLRDWLYDKIAKRRYRLSRSYRSCRIPTPEIKSRFID